MVWLNSATKKLLGRQTQPRLNHKDIICVHTMVGYLKTTEAMFHRGGFTGTESHFGIGGKWGADAPAGLDGEVWQFQDTDFTADANYKGSWHIISIETADNAPRLPPQIEKWTPKQVDALVDLIVELCLRYDIPPVLIPDTKPTRRGLAYHYQGVGPNLVPGGEVWSAAGHECPGPVRIKQFKEEVIPRVQAEMKGLDVDEKTLRKIISEELTSDKNVKVLAEKLFSADVVAAPDVEVAKDPTNKTWQVRSYLNRLVNNTTPKETP